MFTVLGYPSGVLRLDHIVMDGAERMSPLWVSCYSDEDMVACRLFLLAFSGVCMQVFVRVSVARALACSTLCISTKVGKVKSMAMMATPRLLGRQVLERWASFVAIRWSRQLGM